MGSLPSFYDDGMIIMLNDITGIIYWSYNLIIFVST